MYTRCSVAHPLNDNVGSFEQKFKDELRFQWQKLCCFQRMSLGSHQPVFHDLRIEFSKV
jgi:hypothetical protein